MSTGATISVCGITFFQASDGNPESVIPTLKGLIKSAREMSERNPDFPFLRSLSTIMKDSEEYDYDEYCNGFPADYAYKVDEDGEIEHGEIE